jgi:hypothetical protein
MFGILVYEHDRLRVGLVEVFILLAEQRNFLIAPYISN